MSTASPPAPTALPAPIRGPATVLALVAAVAVVALGTALAGRTTSSHADDRLAGLVASWVPDPGRVWRLIEVLGDPLPVVAASGVLATVCLATRRHRLAVLAVAGPGLSGGATTLLKPLFDRTIEGGLAYPSGHTAAVTALGIVTALILVDLLRAGAVTRLLVLSATALVVGVVMGVTLVALDIHYPTDTIGGFSTAVAVVLGAALLIDRIADAVTARHRAAGPAPT